MEEARGYRALMSDFGLTQEAVSTSVGKSRPAIANALRLLNLDPEVAAMLESGQLSSGHARALLPLPAAAQLEAAKLIVSRGLSVRQTETLVASLLKEPAAKKEKDPSAVDYAAVMSARLSEALGRKVNIVDGRKRGRIELEYYGADDREALLQALMTLKK
jgi:ParB family chromosome partitioning protein